jgi:hypothetical protein
VEQGTLISTEPKEQSHEIDVFLFIQNKTEKLSAAVYMVTSYIADTEPVKSLLRVSAFSSAGHASHLVLKQHANQFHELEKDIVHILSLTKLSHTLGIMSHMNGEILTTEYNKLLGLLRTQKGHKHSPILTTHTEHDLHHYTKSLDTKGQIFKGHIQNDLENKTEVKGVSVENNKTATIAHPSVHTTRASVPTTVPSVVVSTNKQTVYTTPKKVVAPVVNTENKERRSDRQLQVLAALSTDRESGIKDIAARIKGCSEKTIQRELNELTLRNKIKRTGEKRWSRYIRVQ